MEDTTLITAFVQRKAANDDPIPLDVVKCS